MAVLHEGLGAAVAVDADDTGEARLGGDCVDLSCECHEWFTTCAFCTQEQNGLLCL